MSPVANSRPLRRSVLIGIALGVITLLVALTLFDMYRKRGAAAAASAAGTPTAVPVVVEAARREALPKQIEAIGTVVADQQVLVAAEVAGRITALHFSSGQSVKAGTPLAQLNDAPMQRELERHRAAATLADASLARAHRLKDLVLSRAEYEQHQASHAQQHAQVAQILAEIAQRRVRAPFDGVLGVRQVNLGQFVEAGTPIATLTDLRHLHVDFRVPERFLPLLSEGLAVQLSVDGVSDSGVVGRISAIDPRVNQDDRMVNVRSTLTAPGKGNLWPGAFARVLVTLPPDPPAVTVPAIAISASLAGDSLYVVRENAGKPQARLLPVQTDMRHGDRIALRNSDLQAGELVVVSGQINLQDGAWVSISASAAAPNSIAARKEQ